MTPPNRRGIALPLAVYLLALVASMIAVVLYPVWVERRLAHNDLKMRQAFAAAEAGLADGVVLAGSGALSGARTFDGQLRTGRYHGELRPVSAGLVLVVVEGWSGDGVARQRLGLLVTSDGTPSGVRRVAGHAWANLY